MVSTNPSIVRFSPTDEQTLLSLIRLTSARSKADVVRRALELFAWMWDLHLLGASFAVHADEGEIYTLHMGKVAEGGADDKLRSHPLTRSVQLRLRDDHQAILDRLIETGAATSRSAAVRAAIELYREIIDEMQEEHSFTAVFPEGHSLKSIPVPVPGARAAKVKHATSGEAEAGSTKQRRVGKRAAPGAGGIGISKRKGRGSFSPAG